MSEEVKNEDLRTMTNFILMRFVTMSKYLFQLVNSHAYLVVFDGLIF